MKVYEDVAGEKRLVGRADIAEDEGPVYEVRLFGATSIIREQFTIGTVTHPPIDGPLTVERAVLLSAGQRPEILPGWTPLTS
jgi:hypothetical protein